MLAVAFVRWWYGAGWKLVQKNVRKRMERTSASFSIPTLMRTLFAPWKRIITSPGAGLNAYFRAMIDNTVSRFVGFTIRIFVLFAAGICMLAVSVAGVLQIFLWPLMPFLVVACIAKGLMP